MNKKRRVCSFCSQELADTAFFRHQSDTTGSVCPGKKLRQIDVTSEEEISDRESIKHSTSPRGLDSTFDLGSSDDENSDCQHNPGMVLDSPSDNSFEISSSELSSTSSECSSLDGNEIWEDEDKKIMSKVIRLQCVKLLLVFITF